MVCSKAVVLLLWIHCLLFFRIFGPCFVMKYLVSFLIFLHLADLCLLAVMWLLCSIFLPHSAEGWSAVCDCGISCSYSHIFFDPGWAAFLWVVRLK